MPQCLLIPGIRTDSGMIRSPQGKLLRSKMAADVQSTSVVAGHASSSISGQAPAKPTLFRREVLEFQQHTRQWGRVVPLQPLPVRFTVWLIAIAVAAAVAFLFLAQYARKETALG